MSTVNQKAQGVRKDAHLNYMGGLSYDLSDPLLKLRIAASTCFFGEPMYYQRDPKAKRQPVGRAGSGLSDRDIEYLRKTLNALDPKEWRKMTPAQLIESADVEATLIEAVRLRDEEHIRLTPQVILVRAANHKNSKGTGLIRQYASKIIQRADEPSTVLAYQLSAFGKPIPNSLKRAVADRLSSFSDYQLAKYRMENKEFKTVDAVNMFHPKATKSLGKLMKDKLTVEGETWEAIISEKGSTKKAWTEALEKMGHMALLRNLRNLLEKGVEPATFLGKLVEGAKDGKQLPFRYYSAYRALQEAGIKTPTVADAIEQCMTIAIGNLPHFEGRVMSLCDNSGSAQGATTSSLGTMQVSTIGNLTGVLTGMASDEGYVGVFGDRLSEMAIRKRSSIFDQLKEAERLAGSIGQGTENGIWLFWDKAIKNKEHWDHVFVYSDMQAGHGGLYGTNATAYRDYLWNGSNHIDVPKLINKYRGTVNPDVKVYLVQIAGQQDVIIPEFYDKTYILGGWGESLLKFAKFVSSPRKQKAAKVEKVEEPKQKVFKTVKKVVKKKAVKKKRLSQ